VEPSRAAITAAATTVAMDSNAPAVMIRRRRSTQAAGWHTVGGGPDQRALRLIAR
jgi:hypothetical protein